MLTRLRQNFNRLLRLFGYQIKSVQQLPNEKLLGISQRYNIRTILDAGANEGQFALWSREFFPEATIYSFEPVHTTFKTLELIAKEKHQWDVFQVALSDTCEDRHIFHHINHPSSSSLHESTATEIALFPDTKEKVLENVSCVTLDHWLKNSKIILNEDILLKLDVQGHETCVLMGAKDVLAKTSVVIAEVIVGSLYHEQARFVDIVHLLAESGFQFQGVLEHGFDQSGSVISLDAVFIKDSSK
jgi:FkbM family methyltransferase